MKPGEIKTVFTDIVNKEVPEGRVILLARLPDDDICRDLNCENWRVKFLDTGITDAAIVNLEQPKDSDELFDLGVQLSKLAGGVA
jgi:hypothetical protein